MRRLMFCAVVGLIVGCAGGEVPPPSAAHPASPNAPEGAATVASSPSAAPPAASGEHAGHSETGDKVTYTCPMHPEVVSDKPGNCPKCGMTLVPKK